MTSGGWLAAAWVVCAGAASILFSWERWINPFVDGGREMIVPARLADGQLLYKDVMYHYGPAAPWFNAAALKLFGRNLVVLELVGLAFSALIFWSLFRLTRRAGSRLSAAAGTALAAALCVGAPNGGAFLFPYAFDALFALAGAFFALERLSGPASRLVNLSCAMGLALALASKPEVGGAAALVVLASAFRSERRREDLRRHATILLAGVGSAGLAYAVAFRGLTWEISCCEGPLSLFSPPQEWRNVFRVASGLADPAGSANRLLTATFLDLLLLGAVGFLASRRRPSSRAIVSPWEMSWFVLLVAAVAFLASHTGGSIEDRLPPLFLPMPIIALAAAGWSLRSPLAGASRSRFLLFAFSGLFATRVVIGLAYGAYTTPYSIFALPGLIATAAVLVFDRLGHRLPDARAFRRCAAALFAALAVLGVLRLERLRPRSAWVLVKTDAGSLHMPAERANAVRETLEYLRWHARHTDRLVGFPETGFFNFVTGLVNPLRQDTIYPAILDAAAEERVAQRLENEKTGPRFVLLINQPAPAFGQFVFGADYAVRIWQVVSRRYRLAASFGNAPADAPVGWPRFFIRIYERAP
ncbi:MAG: hypothetical protein ACRD3M_11730 [Thermoanaerobaculia bacterium]